MLRYEPEDIDTQNAFFYFAEKCQEKRVIFPKEERSFHFYCVDESGQRKDLKIHYTDEDEFRARFLALNLMARYGFGMG